MKYRPEIDGLRALAVTPVVLFHAGFSGFSGGYVGVDVFFVISGYLITSIILNELQQQRFSILNFYERRARRILPALGFMALLTTIGAYLLMPADLLTGYSASLINVATFTSNFYFYLSSGYFATAAELKPLLHTWSLAVEEQFYLFFPLLLMLMWRYPVSRLITCLVMMSLASFFYGQYLLSQDAQDANFYLIFSRAWELFCGALLAFINLNKWQSNRLISEAGSVLGLGLIVYAVIRLDHHTPFPGYATLYPVAGTLLLLAFTSGHSLIGRLLSLKPLVYLGLISYSWYLWHQPILAFLKMKVIGAMPVMHLSTALVASLVLAMLSYHFIEQPFRKKHRFSRQHIFTGSAILLAAMIIIGVTGHHYQGYPDRFDAVQYQKSTSPMHGECNTRGQDYLPPSQACEYLGEDITWAILGDSHIVEPAYALARRLKTHNQGLLHLEFTACPNGYTLELKHPAGCSDWSKEAVAEILSRDHIKNVLVAYRYSMHLFGADFSQYPTPPDKSPRNNLTAEFRRHMKGTAREQYWHSFKHTIDVLLQAGKRVHIIYPIPELPVSFDQAATPLSVFSDETILNLEQATTMEFYLDRNRYILSKLDALPYDDQLIALKPTEVLCDDRHCTAVRGDQALYRDDDHLTVHGADLIIQMIELNP
jgi:peptidoglycan/LPS O-acetylase OafA/YrhL